MCLCINCMCMSYVLFCICLFFALKINKLQKKITANYKTLVYISLTMMVSSQGPQYIFVFFSNIPSPTAVIIKMILSKRFFLAFQDNSKEGGEISYGRHSIFGHPIAILSHRKGNNLLLGLCCCI